MKELGILENLTHISFSLCVINSICLGVYIHFA
jgi:hypothetical protein